LNALQFLKPAASTFHTIADEVDQFAKLLDTFAIELFIIDLCLKPFSKRFDLVSTANQVLQIRHAFVVFLTIEQIRK
jgi:hypothetical protein